MAGNDNTKGGSFHSIRLNGKSINDAYFKSCINSEGVFNLKGITIKPSGSVRIGSTKIHPSGLIQIGTDLQIEGSILPANVAIGRTGAVPKSYGGTSKRTHMSTILGESPDKINVQPKKAASETNKSASGETQASSTGRKRKSTEAAPESAKKQKTISEVFTTTSAGDGSVTAGPSSAPKDIYDVVLDRQYSDDVPVHESCDQVRRKIYAHLAQPGVTKAQFCRDMQAQLHSARAPKRIQSKMLDDFLNKHGPTHGCTSSVYYAAYVFFEKWRIVKDEAKSKHRLEMEKRLPMGADREVDVATRGIYCGPNDRPRQDSYGQWHRR